MVQKFGKILLFHLSFCGMLMGIIPPQFKGTVLQDYRSAKSGTVKNVLVR
jgi:hypothetical protein